MAHQKERQHAATGKERATEPLLVEREPSPTRSILNAKRPTDNR